MLSMDTKAVAIPGKKAGGKRLFSEAIEDEIARHYYDLDWSSTELAAKYSPLSKTSKCSPTTIRNIARVAQLRRIARGEAAA
jgi:hypothetical protein